VAGSDRPDERASPTLGFIAFTSEDEGRSRDCAGIELNLFSIRYKLQCYNYRAGNVVFVVSVMGSIRGIIAAISLPQSHCRILIFSITALPD
jgi:hypothetical protein